MAVHPKSLSNISARKLQRALAAAGAAVARLDGPFEVGDIRALDAALAGKLDASAVSGFGLTLIIVADAAAATALLEAFAGGAKGLVPVSAGGTANFLRADGVWAVPP